MLSKEELEALVLVLQRAPLNKAEALAIEAILAKLVAAQQAAAPGDGPQDR